MRGVISFAQAQGDRDYQEDRIVHLPISSRKNRLQLLAVFDGHGGSGVSDLCAKVISKIFNPDAGSMKDELVRVIETLHYRTCFQESGSTVSLVCIDEINKIATAAHLGDSPVFVVDSVGNAHRSVDHNVGTNLGDREAVIRRGGAYHDGNIVVITGSGDEQFSHQLQLSRTLGDCEFSHLLDRTPYVAEYELGSHSAVIIGSDGIFNFAEEIPEDRIQAEIIEMVQRSEPATEMLGRLEKNGLEDNTSLIVWRPKRLKDWFF